MDAGLSSVAFTPVALSLLWGSPGILPGKFPQTSMRSQGCQHKKQHLISQCMIWSKYMSHIFSWPISQALWLLLCPGHLHGTWDEALNEKKEAPWQHARSQLQRPKLWAPTPLKLQYREQEDLTQEPTPGKSPSLHIWSRAPGAVHCFSDNAVPDEPTCEDRTHLIDNYCRKV